MAEMYVNLSWGVNGLRVEISARFLRFHRIHFPICRVVETARITSSPVGIFEKRLFFCVIKIIFLIIKSI